MQESVQKPNEDAIKEPEEDVKNERGKDDKKEQRGETAIEKEDSVPAELVLSAVSTASVLSRPRSFSALSEISKPDPPSMIDLREARRQDSVRSDNTTSLPPGLQPQRRKDENRINSRILQAALSQNENGGDSKQKMSAESGAGDFDREGIAMTPLAETLQQIDVVHSENGVPLTTNFAHSIVVPNSNGMGSNHPAMATTIMASSAIQPPSSSQSSFGPTGGRRRVRLRLEEEISAAEKEANAVKELNTGGGDDFVKGGLFGQIRRRTSWAAGDATKSNAETAKALAQVLEPIVEGKNHSFHDRGTLTLSWYEGTSTYELQEHVRRSIERKLQLSFKKQVVDIRVFLDEEDEDTPEEIVISPFIPDGSHLLVQFGTRNVMLHQMSSMGDSSPVSFASGAIRPPKSPSEAPSPVPHNKEGLNTKELLRLTRKLNSLRNEKAALNTARSIQPTEDKNQAQSSTPAAQDAKETSTEETMTKKETVSNGENDHHEDKIDARLRQITELLLDDRKSRQQRKSAPVSPHHDKKQVVFVLANYFVLFLSLIYISAAVESRLPYWLAWLETEMKMVENCATNKDALFDCVSRGDVAGLVASVFLWLSRSAATRRVFLFGFESPMKLWTVVYESFITAICWGVSYLFIRRGMNSDTRRNFIHKYWKDAVYGSLAGFNASFMKQVLKNLIPQSAVEHAVEDALRERHLKILDWLPQLLNGDS